MASSVGRSDNKSDKTPESGKKEEEEEEEEEEEVARLRGATTDQRRAEAAESLREKVRSISDSSDQGLTTTWNSMVGTGAADALVTALKACGNNEFGGRVARVIEHAIFSELGKVAKELSRELVTVGAIQALAPKLAIGGDGSMYSAGALYLLCAYTYPAGFQLLRNRSIRQALERLDATWNFGTYERRLWSALFVYWPSGEDALLK